ncbi:MAG: hypothetical protein OEV44_00245 [Spirochaetota bacterium]|nr:hypothetical protein [Spirochaetota bacterium]
MNRQTSIIYMTNPPECWTNLKKFCNAKGISYYTTTKKAEQLESEGLNCNGIKFYRVKNQ